MTIIVNPPPFTLEITPSPSQIQFNDVIPTTIQVRVVPQVAGFNQAVTVTVPDGALDLVVYGGCPDPPGFVSYNGTLTFTVNPPYDPVTFCEQGSGPPTGGATPGNDSTTITAFTSGANPVSVDVNMRVGVPQIVVTRASTFNVPFGGT